jgi:hypothetical protein
MTDPRWINRLGALVLIFTVWLVSVWMFFIQPMVGKIILPRFGGHEAVWMTAMYAFSLMSCVGLLVAWLLSTFRRKRWAIGVIMSGFIVIVINLATQDRQEWHSPHQYLAPFCGALCLLFVLQVILPYWFGQAAAPAWVDPYFVLAFAHLGAIMSMVGYPILIEPSVPIIAQYPLWLIGFAAIGLLFLLCTGLLQLSSLMNAASGSIASVAVGRPTWPRRFRWAVLGGLPTMLLSMMPTTLLGRASLHVGIAVELMLVIAFIRLPSGKPSILSRAVQIVAVLTFLLSSRCAAEDLTGPDEAWLTAFVIIGVTSLALIPHRWTLLLQGAICLPVLVVSFAEVAVPGQWTYIFQLAVLVVIGWGCFGAMVRDRPGPERLPEFLFFTGLAPSAVFGFVPFIMPLISQQLLYPAFVLLAFLARFLPGADASTQSRNIDDIDGFDDDAEMPAVTGTSIRALD